MVTTFRHSDAVIGDSGRAAILCLTSLIERAVRSSDDASVAELDRVLRYVEIIVDAAGVGRVRSPGDVSGNNLVADGKSGRRH